ncbi:MAG: HEAT repeat domain-containing protein [Thermodesulfobacteriota bacterium]|nr:HEAT repeat domain-containing protein [Thermodesulfobacteriota bacterium]
MNRQLYPLKSILLGLAVAQVLATVFVYLSNAGLHDKVLAIEAAGYLAIPNRHIRPSLLEFWPAFYGGLFFTFTIGAALSVASLAGAWIWDRLFKRKRGFLIFPACVWLGSLALVNSRGADLFASSFFFCVPPIVFFAGLRWMPRQSQEKTWPMRLAFLLPLVVTALVWLPRVDGFIFLDVRDFLLLSNPVGQKVNDFYYQYTLYPAEAFKSLDQKTLKTCKPPLVKNAALAKRLEKILLRHDYLSLSGESPVDLEITARGQDLLFSRKDRMVLQTSLKAFPADPAGVLDKFSALTDKHMLLRRAVFFSLIVGLPLTLYVPAFNFLNWAAGLFLRPIRAAIAAAVICLTLGLLLPAPLYPARAATAEGFSALTSPAWPARVAGLRTIWRQGLEISDFPAYRKFLTSPHIPERYWLAAALGKSRDPETYRDIVFLLDDPQANVVCIAFQSLGRRRGKAGVPEILKRIRASEHWYVQWYAYRALRGLSWRQARSK